MSISKYMERKKIFLTYFPFFFCWSLDFYIKSWAIGNAFKWLQFGPINLAYHENHGIILGSFEKLPLLLRTVFLSTIGISIVASFPLIMGLIHFKSKKTVIGLSLLFGGILGNVTDRILYGFVVDIIYIKTSWFVTPVVNVADICQWIAYILIAQGFFSELNYHLPNEDRRTIRWINPKFQYKFCITLVSIVFFTTSIPVFFGLTFFKYVLQEIAFSEEADTRYYLISFFITSVFIQLTLCIITIRIGKIISERIAGPIIGIRRYLNDTIQGKYYNFSLREKDDFKDLEAPLNELNKKLNGNL